MAIDVVYKFKTPLESRLLSKQLYGAVDEGLICLPEVFNQTENQFSIRNLSFYYKGRVVSGVTDPDAEQRIFHISYMDPEGLTFTVMSPTAIALGFRYPYTGDDNNKVVINSTLFEVIYSDEDTSNLVKFDENGKYRGLILLRLKRDNVHIWQGSSVCVDWTQKLFQDKNVPEGYRLAPMTPVKDGELVEDYNEELFYVKRRNQIVPHVPVFIKNKSSMEAEFFKMGNSIELSGLTVGGWYAIGFRTTTDSTPTSGEVKLEVITQEADGWGTSDAAIADFISVQSSLNYSCALVAVIKWDSLNPKIVYFDSWDVSTDFTSMSPSYFTLNEDREWEVKKDAINTNELKDNAVVASKINNSEITRNHFNPVSSVATVGGDLGVVRGVSPASPTSSGKVTVLNAQGEMGICDGKGGLWYPSEPGFMEFFYDSANPQAYEVPLSVGTTMLHITAYAGGGGGGAGSLSTNHPDNTLFSSFSGPYHGAGGGGAGGSGEYFDDDVIIPTGSTLSITVGGGGIGGKTKPSVFGEILNGVGYSTLAGNGGPTSISWSGLNGSGGLTLYGGGAGGPGGVNTPSSVGIGGVAGVAGGSAGFSGGKGGNGGEEVGFYGSSAGESGSSGSGVGGGSGGTGGSAGAGSSKGNGGGGGGGGAISSLASSNGGNGGNGQSSQAMTLTNSTDGVCGGGGGGGGGGAGASALNDSGSDGSKGGDGYVYIKWS